MSLTGIGRWPSQPNYRSVPPPRPGTPGLGGVRPFVVSCDVDWRGEHGMFAIGLHDVGSLQMVWGRVNGQLVASGSRRERTPKRKGIRLRVAHFGSYIGALQLGASLKISMTIVPFLLGSTR